MLKIILVASLVSFANLGNAQTPGYATTISIDTLFATFKPAEAHTLTAQTQFGLGAFDLQADYAFSGIYDSPLFATPASPRITLELSTFGMHGNYRISDAVRAGGFATYQVPHGLSGYGTATLGGEAMLSFGKTDIEAAAAYEIALNTSTAPKAGNLFLAVYHTVNQQLELSLQSSAWVSDLGPVSRIILASANARYTLKNVPMSLSLGIENAIFTWRAPLTSVRIGVSYEFGTPSGYRAFGKRGLSFAELTVAARS